MLKLCHDLWRLLRSWWRVDRVHIPRGDGALLRMPISSVLGVDGRWWTVESRVVAEGPRESFVRYGCRDGAMIAFLEVRPSPPFGPGTIDWIVDGLPRELNAGEIEVYAIASE